MGEHKDQEIYEQRESKRLDFVRVGKEFRD